MNKITQKKLNLDLVLKDVEKYCFSELSYEKIKNLEYIINYDKLVEVHKENEEASDLLRKYPNEFKLKIFDYNASVKKAKIDSVLSEKELFYILRNIITCWCIFRVQAWTNHANILFRYNSNWLCSINVI